MATKSKFCSDMGDLRKRRVPQKANRRGHLLQYRAFLIRDLLIGATRKTDFNSISQIDSASIVGGYSPAHLGLGGLFKIEGHIDGRTGKVDGLSIWRPVTDQIFERANIAKIKPALGQKRPSE
jgi:hypothetical protein